MIRLLLITLFSVGLIALGLIYGPVIAENTGYVLITVAGWKIEMTIVSALVMLLLAWFVFWFVAKVIGTFLAMGHFSFRWFADLGGSKQKWFDEALLGWFSNDLEKSRKALSKLGDGEFDGFELLLLADVAAKQQEPELQKEALLKAAKIAKTRDTANFLLAQTQVRQGEQTSGLALIENSQNGAALLLKLEAMANNGQWRDVSTSLEKWKRKLPREQYSHYKSLTANGLMSEIASKEGANQLITYWEKQSGKVRKNSESQAAFIKQLLAQGLHQEAESYLVKMQPKQPVPELLPLFKELKLKQPVESRKKLETWLKNDEQNPELLSVLGHLAFHAQDYILAEKVLQKAIKLTENKNDIHLLAQVKEATQENLQALQLYKQLV